MIRKTLLFFMPLCFFTYVNITMAYTPSKISITDHEFSRYIRPQLKNIVQDYNSLLLSFNPKLEHFRDIFPLYEQLQNQTSRYIGTCIKNFSAKVCRESLTKVKDTVYKIIQSQHKDKKLLPETSLSQERKGKYREDLLELYNQVYLTSLFVSDDKKQKRKLLSLPRKVKFNRILFNSYLLTLTPLEEEIADFWSNLIQPIIFQILLTNNKKPLIHKMNRLNGSLNYLAVLLTKKRKDTPKKAKTLIKIIHRRWNSILKMALKN